MTDLVDSPIRTIPANLDAERAVLGAIMLDPDAIIKVASFLRPEDFYRERHGWLYDAMLGLNERHEPLDFVTLIDELERRGKLEEIGGPAYINDLISGTPTALYVDFYARIVERTAVLRRLISAAGKIAELAYDESQEVDNVVDRAEQIIFGVSESRIHRDLTPIRAIMAKVVDHIDFLSRNQGALMGVPTGFRELDQMLGGLQKSDLIILAGRPGMGKTGLGLSIAQNAAKRYAARIALFSLEMSNEQLVQRLLAMETGIDSHRLRMGQVAEDEWPILMEAANGLSGTSFFIDDTPAASVNEIRTKARRLYAEHGLDLVVIDYMQLMSGQSGVRNENRQQEISYISRALKALARELNVPVIALSQLSRAVESRADKRPMLSDLRESGCLAAETPVYLPDEGITMPIGELAGRSGFRILSLNTATWKHEPALVSHAFCTGEKPVYRIVTQLGRTVRATANHRFRTVNGWKRLDEIGKYDRIAVPKNLLGQVRHARSNLAQAVHLSELARPDQDEKAVLEYERGTRRDTDTSCLSFGRQNGHDISMSLLPVWLCSPELAKLAESDVYWDAVASIEPDGIASVYDLTVPGNHNFVAGNVFVHNSIEQDADVVLFIYRDDYYDEDSEQQNIAELMVAKHRHGSTGKVSLFFRKELTQFRDLERRVVDLEY